MSVCPEICGRAAGQTIKARKMKFGTYKLLVNALLHRFTDFRYSRFQGRLLALEVFGGGTFDH